MNSSATRAHLYAKQQRACVEESRSALVRDWHDANAVKQRATINRLGRAIQFLDKRLDRMTATTWTCHAHPVDKSGKPCGHINTAGENVSKYGMAAAMEFCAGCGCTKKASDDRLARKVARS